MAAMKKIVLEVALKDDALADLRTKLIDADANSGGKITVVGVVDPVEVVTTLRRFAKADIVSVGPAKEPNKEDDGGPPLKRKKKEDDGGQDDESYATNNFSEERIIGRGGRGVVYKGDEDDQRKMHWFAWWKMCVPKEKGIQTFKKGCIWRVGDGRKIDIWEDSWIPSSPSRKIVTRRGSCLLSQVSDLIDPTSGEWDEPLIRDNFWSLDVERILQIPLSQQNFEDNVAWHYTKTGVFSVRSAYYCEWDDQYGSKLGQEGGQSSSMNHPAWKQVWKLKMPGKVKIFIWRCLHNAIPFRSTLANRHIPVSGECPVCHAGAEDSKHALFGCKRARSVWLELGLLDEINKATPTDREGAKVIEFLLCDDKFRRNYMDIVDIPEVIASTCWYLWWQRREMAKGEHVQNPFRTSMAIRALSLSYVRAVSKPNPVDRQKTWKSAQTGMQILNVDAAFTEEDHTGACGMVVRDHDGGFIAAATTQMTCG